VTARIARANERDGLGRRVRVIAEVSVNGRRMEDTGSGRRAAGPRPRDSFDGGAPRIVSSKDSGTSTDGPTWRRGRSAATTTRSLGACHVCSQADGTSSCTSARRMSRCATSSSRQSVRRRAGGGENLAATPSLRRRRLPRIIDARVSTVGNPGEPVRARRSSPGPPRERSCPRERSSHTFLSPP